MRFAFCPSCGARLGERPLGDDGMVPWCERCGRPWWDAFTTAVICAVIDERGRTALIRQSYGDTGRFVCVAGFMKPGETAEEAVRREVLEEIGQQVEDVRFIRSYVHQGKDMLMLGFAAHVLERPFRLSDEVAEAVWLPPGEALERLKNSRIAALLVRETAEKELKSE